MHATHGYVRLVLVVLILALIAVLAGMTLSQAIRMATAPDVPDTADSTGWGVSTLVSGLEIPWALAVLPDGSMLITERPGRIRYYDAVEGLREEPLLTLPQVEHRGEGGLLGITIHPSFESAPYVYVYYTYLNQSALTNRVSRFTLNGLHMVDAEIILDGIPGASIHNGGRIRFGPDGYLYVTTGDAAHPELSQSPQSLAGKILRVTDDGGIPADNPFPGSPVYSLGHRNPQGLAWDSRGQLWATEHGARATDELNLIQPGLNYGWPVITGDQTMSGLEAPMLHSGRETWAPSGMAYLDGYLYFSGLRGQSLYRVDSENDITIQRQLHGEFGRLREVVSGPGGTLYLLTSNRDGRGSPVADDDRLIQVTLPGVSDS